MTELHHLESDRWRTLAPLSSHPLPSKIKWPETLALHQGLAGVITESNDLYRVAVDNHAKVFRPPHRGDDYPHGIMRFRHFLAPAEITASPPDADRDFIVVVDHHSVMIYHDKPFIEQLRTVVPDDHGGRLCQLRHFGSHYQGQLKPEKPSCYRAIADLLQGAQTILIFGHGDGHFDSARVLRDQLIEHLTEFLPRIITSTKGDVGYFTERQLVAATVQLLDDEKGQHGA